MGAKTIFKKGDNIAGESFTTGKYLGLVELYEQNFHKIYDGNKKLTIFLSADSENVLRKLPSDKKVKENLKVFNINDIIDAQKIEGSRYRYFKSKVAKNKFKSSTEVLHDLKILIARKKASVAERKLFLNLKEQLLHEISLILDMTFDEAEAKYLH